VRNWLVVLGLLVLATIALGVVVIVVTSSDDTLVLDLGVGECFELTLDADLAEIRTVTDVDCGEPHLAEVVVVGELAPDGTAARPSDQELFAEVDERCAAALTSEPVLLERFGILPVVADERAWDAFDGRFVCVAIPYGGVPTTGSAFG